MAKIMGWILFAVFILFLITALIYIVVLINQPDNVIVVEGSDNFSDIKQEQTNQTIQENNKTDIENKSDTNNKTESDDKHDTEDKTKNNNENQKDESGQEDATGEECLDNYGLTKNTIIFYYSEDFHSQKMMSIVKELENNYNFYKTNNIWNTDFNECFGLSGETPVFVCAGTKEKLTGETSKSILESFAVNCK